MKLAETVTFGGSGLDRAAQHRGDAAWLAKALEHGKAVAFWHGKPLVSGEDDLTLTRLDARHPVIREAAVKPVFLGLDEDVPVFAFDVSAWEPEDMQGADFTVFFDPSEQHHPALPDDHRFTELRGIMTRLSNRDAELAATGKAILGWHITHRHCAKCGAESAIAQAGWQRDCPACDGHHFPRTDPVVIMLITRGNSVLMGRSPNWPEGMFSLLAGFVEPGETIEAAVRREVFEEAGIRVGPVEYLASQPWAFPSSLMFGCRGEALNDEIVIDPLEIEDARWITREEMMQAFAGQHPELKPARRGAIAHFILRNWLADRLD